MTTLRARKTLIDCHARPPPDLAHMTEFGGSPANRMPDPDPAVLLHNRANHLCYTYTLCATGNELQFTTYPCNLEPSTEDRPRRARMIGRTATDYLRSVTYDLLAGRRHTSPPGKTSTRHRHRPPANRHPSLRNTSALGCCSSKNTSPTACGAAQPGSLHS